MTKREQVLSMLESAADGVTGWEFTEAGIHRYSARIEELRKRGYEISTERIKQGRFKFRLVGSPGEAVPLGWVEPQRETDGGGGDQAPPPPPPLFSMPEKPKVFACDLRNSPYWEED